MFVSITSLDEELIGRLEPRTTRPRGRLSTIAALAAAGIPTGVMVAPMIPGLTEHEIPTILKAAAEAGARWAGYTIVRLPLGVAGLFEDWLGQHFPDRKEKVLERIRAMRGGRLNDSRFGVRMSGEGNAAIMISQIFQGACRRAGLNRRALARDRGGFPAAQPRRPPAHTLLNNQTPCAILPDWGVCLKSFG